MTRRHANELLVAASLSEEDADTHWLRSEFDHFLVQEVVAAGIPCLDRTQLTELSYARRWTLDGQRLEEPCRIRADFIIDASGAGGFLARQLAIPEHAAGLRTASRAIYGHFRGVRSWREMLTGLGGQVDDHPFPADSAALHHVLDGAWMYVLPFDNGVTSAGFMLDDQRFPLDVAIPVDLEWARLMARYPSIARQFELAELAAPIGGLARTSRLQRRARQTTGPGWAMLPLAAYTLDALHSTGNAHTLSGIERLASLLEQHWGRPELTAGLSTYGQALEAEISMLDRFVHASYSSFRQFELFVSFAMFYFAAATFSEHRRRAGLWRMQDSHSCWQPSHHSAPS